MCISVYKNCFWLITFPGRSKRNTEGEGEEGRVDLPTKAKNEVA